MYVLFSVASTRLSISVASTRLSFSVASTRLSLSTRLFLVELVSSGMPLEGSIYISPSHCPALSNSLALIYVQVGVLASRLLAAPGSRRASGLEAFSHLSSRRSFATRTHMVAPPLAL